MEKNQKTMISLERIQIYESRLGVLETRDDGLAQQETELDSQVSTLQRAYSTTEAGIGPTGIPRESGPDPALRTTTTQQYETARRQLDIIRSKKQQVESEMTTLRARLAALQTSLDADTTN